jgi:tetratricopeptide (TPR) repeat protein
MAIFNAGAIYGDLGNAKKAIEILDKAGALYPKNKEIWSLNGQLKYQVKDMKGADAALRHALELDPQDATNHQFLFYVLNALGDKTNSVSEYTIYKALGEGTRKTDVKLWVNSADNRLGAANQLKTIFKTEGYPDEVYTYSEEGGKTFETWFFWSKGKSYTFMEGQVFAKGQFPPKKSG